MRTMKRTLLILTGILIAVSCEPIREIKTAELTRDALAALPNRYADKSAYLYEYNTQVLTAAPDHSRSITGHRLRAMVLLRERADLADRPMELALFNISLGELNSDNLTTAEQKVMLPLDVFSTDRESTNGTISREFLEQLVEDLVRPVHFQWQYGLVQRVWTVEADSEWSVNLKKALIALLQVNKKAQLRNRNVGDDNQVAAADETSVFAGVRDGVSEIIPAGKCDTVYEFREPSSETPGLWTVVKTPKADRCFETRSGLPRKWWTEVPNVMPCEMSPMKDTEFLDTEEVTEMYVKQPRKLENADFFIVNVQSRGVYTPAPFVGRIAASRLQTVVLQELNIISEVKSNDAGNTQVTLEAIKKSAKPVEADAAFKTSPAPEIERAEVLELLATKDQVQKTERIYTALLISLSREIRELVKRENSLLQEETSASLDKESDTASPLIATLNRLLPQLRMLKKAHLLDLLLLRNSFAIGGLKVEHVSRRTMYEIANLLPLMNTNDAAEIVVRVTKMHLEASRELPAYLHDREILANLFRRLMQTDFYDIEIIRELFALLKLPIFKNVLAKQPTNLEDVQLAHLYETMWLGESSLVNNLLARYWKALVKVEETAALSALPGRFPSDVRDIEKLLVKEVRRLWQHADPEPYRLIMLKVLGNNAILDTLPLIIEEFADMSKHGVELQVEMIKSLRTLCRYLTRDIIAKFAAQPLRANLLKARAQVIAFLVRLYADSDAELEVRLTAFKVLNEVQPEKPLVRLLLNTAVRSRRPELEAFVFSYYSDMINVGEPSGRRTNRKCNFVLCGSAFRQVVREAVTSVRFRREAALKTSTAVHATQVLSFNDDKVQPVGKESTVSGILSTEMLFTEEAKTRSVVPRSVRAQLMTVHQGAFVELGQLEVRQEDFEINMEAVMRLFTQESSVLDGGDLAKLLRKLLPRALTYKARIAFSLRVFGRYVASVRFSLQDMHNPFVFAEKLQTLTRVLRALDGHFFVRETPLLNGFTHSMHLGHMHRFSLFDVAEFRFPGARVRLDSHILAQFSAGFAQAEAGLRTETLVRLDAGRLAAILPRVEVVDRAGEANTPFQLKFKLPLPKTSGLHLLRFKTLPSTFVIARKLVKNEEIAAAAAGVILEEDKWELPMVNVDGKSSKASFFGFFLAELEMTCNSPRALSCYNPLNGPAEFNLITRDMRRQFGDFLDFTVRLGFDAERKTFFGFSVKDGNGHALFSTELSLVRFSRVTANNAAEIVIDWKQKFSFGEALTIRHTISFRYEQSAVIPGLTGDIAANLDKLFDADRKLEMRLKVEEVTEAGRPKSTLLVKEIKLGHAFSGRCNTCLLRNIRANMPSALVQCQRELKLTNRGNPSSEGNSLVAADESNTDVISWATPNCLRVYAYLNRFSRIHVNMKLNRIHPFVERAYFMWESLLRAQLLPFLQRRDRVYPEVAEETIFIKYSLEFEINRYWPKTFDLVFSDHYAMDFYAGITRNGQLSFAEAGKDILENPFRVPAFPAASALLMPRCQKVFNHVETFDLETFSLTGDTHRNLHESNCIVTLLSDCARPDNFSVMFVPKPDISQPQELLIRADDKELLIKEILTDRVTYKFFLNGVATEFSDLVEKLRRMELSGMSADYDAISGRYVITIGRYLTTVTFGNIYGRFDIHQLPLTSRALCGLCTAAQSPLRTISSTDANRLLGQERPRRLASSSVLLPKRLESDAQKRERDNARFADHLDSTVMNGQCKRLQRTAEPKSQRDLVTKTCTVAFSEKNTQHVKSITTLINSVVTNPISQRLRDILKVSDCPLILLDIVNASSRVRYSVFRVSIDRQLDFVLEVSRSSASEPRKLIIRRNLIAKRIELIDGATKEIISDLTTADLISQLNLAITAKDEDKELFIRVKHLPGLLVHLDLANLRVEVPEYLRKSGQQATGMCVALISRNKAPASILKQFTQAERKPKCQLLVDELNTCRVQGDSVKTLNWERFAFTNRQLTEKLAGSKCPLILAGIMNQAVVSTKPVDANTQLVTFKLQSFSVVVKKTADKVELVEVKPGSAQITKNTAEEKHYTLAAGAGKLVLKLATPTTNVITVHHLGGLQLLVSRDRLDIFVPDTVSKWNVLGVCTLTRNAHESTQSRLTRGLMMEIPALAEFGFSKRTASCARLITELDINGGGASSNNNRPAMLRLTNNNAAATSPRRPLHEKIYEDYVMRKCEVRGARRSDEELEARAVSEDGGKVRSVRFNREKHLVVKLRDGSRLVFAMNTQVRDGESVRQMQLKVVKPSATSGAAEPATTVRLDEIEVLRNLASAARRRDILVRADGEELEVSKMRRPDGVKLQYGTVKVNDDYSVLTYNVPKFLKVQVSLVDELARVKFWVNPEVILPHPDAVCKF